jgi:hypothetical protein
VCERDIKGEAGVSLPDEGGRAGLDSRPWMRSRFACAPVRHAGQRERHHASPRVTWWRTERCVTLVIRQQSIDGIVPTGSLVRGGGGDLELLMERAGVPPPSRRASLSMRKEHLRLTRRTSPSASGTYGTRALATHVVPLPGQSVSALCLGDARGRSGQRDRGRARSEQGLRDHPEHLMRRHRAGASRSAWIGSSTMSRSAIAGGSPVGGTLRPVVDRAGTAPTTRASSGSRRHMRGLPGHRRLIRTDRVRGRRGPPRRIGGAGGPPQPRPAVRSSPPTGRQLARPPAAASGRAAPSPPWPARASGVGQRGRELVGLRRRPGPQRGAADEAQGGRAGQYAGSRGHSGLQWMANNVSVSNDGGVTVPTTTVSTSRRGGSRWRGCPDAQQ